MNYLVASLSYTDTHHDDHLYGVIFGIAFILILSPASAGMFLEQIKGFRVF
ncbi:MAG: hypothetical protein MUE75_14460 [Algoriphagus sp.]|nr:hypothetical protein [Algoriphagus sp.]